MRHTTLIISLFVLLNSMPANAAFYVEGDTPAHLHPVENVPIQIVKREKWEITTADKHVSNVVKRWAKRAGQQISWEMGGGINDIPLDDIVVIYEGTYEDAMEKLKASLANGAININLCYYPNIVRVVDAITPCIANKVESK